MVMAILKAGAKPDISVRSGSKRRSVRSPRVGAHSTKYLLWSVISLFKSLARENVCLDESHVFIVYTFEVYAYFFNENRLLQAQGPSPHHSNVEPIA